MKRCSQVAVLLTISAALGFAHPAAAAAAADEDDAFHFTITPYLWLPSASTTLKVSDEPVEVETNTDGFNVFDNLDLALLACGEVRKGKIGLVYDFQYVKLSGDGTANLGRGTDIGVDVKFADATLELGYRVIDEEQFSLTALAGARVMWADVGIDIDTSLPGSGFSGDQDKTWVDPVVGALLRYRFADKWAFNGYGDIGGFGVGSDLTFQVMGTFSYSFNDHFAIQAGYRYWSVDFEDGDFKFDANLHGPLIGLTFTF